MNIILIILSSYLLINGIYFITSLLAASFYKKPAQVNHKQLCYLFIVPAYKEDGVILQTLKAIKNQIYDHSKFEVLLLADSLKSETINEVKKLNISLLQIHFQESTKLKSLKKAIEHHNLTHDYVVMLDADNIIDPDFLTVLNQNISIEDHSVIQLQRAAKNSKEALSFLDAFSEYANEQLLCKGPNVLGLSSKLSGSGMILKMDIFINSISNIEAISGFDKALEIYITNNNAFIHYFESPCIYDEKVEEVQQLSRQRGRWIYAQYDFFRKNFTAGISSLFKGKFDFAHKVLQLGLVPRMIGFMLVLILQIPLYIHVTPNSTSTFIQISQASFLLPYVILFIGFIRYNRLPKGFLQGIVLLFIGYLKAFTQIGKAKGKFLHTGHKINI